MSRAPFADTMSLLLIARMCLPHELLPRMPAVAAFRRRQFLQEHFTKVGHLSHMLRYSALAPYLRCRKNMVVPRQYGVEW